MKSRGRREAKREEGRSGVLVVEEKIRGLGGVRRKKESGDRVLVERRAREDGDEIGAEDGIVRYVKLRCASDQTAQLLFLCFVRIIELHGLLLNY